MGLFSYQTFEEFKAFIMACKPTSNLLPVADVPVIDLCDPNAKTLIVEACTDVGFFKVTNHGFTMEFLNRLEVESIEFFNLSNQEKGNSGPPAPFGYGFKTIGPNGDMGWLEYLLFSANSHPRVPGISDSLWGLMREYVERVKNMSCLIGEMIADEMGNADNNVLSKIMRDEEGDSCFRVNHYPAFSDVEEMRGYSLTGFGAHTDPQILSVLRSNDASGLQICLRNGAWASVPSDKTSFYISVGDSLQVMSNGRFKSIKHRVLANGIEERLAMVYFAGLPPNVKITPLFLAQGEESAYEEFTWAEYKKSAYMTKLEENRLTAFEKFPPVAP